MFVFLLILVFIRPFISSGAFPGVNLLYSQVLVFGLIIWLIKQKKAGQNLRQIQSPLVVFLLVLAISGLSALNKTIAFWTLYQYITAVLLFLFAFSLEAPLKIKTIHTLILAALIISVLAIIQYFFLFDLVSEYLRKQTPGNPFAWDYLSRRRVFIPFITPNILAGYLSSMIALGLTLKGRAKWLSVILFSVVLVLTKSLGGFLTLFASICIYLVLRKDLPRRKFVILGIIILFLIFIFASRHASTRIHTLPEFSLQQRLHYWSDTLKVIAVHPLKGIGIGNFNLPMSRLAHNLLLQIWAEMGIVGLLAFGWLLYAYFKIGLTKIRQNPQDISFVGLFTANLVFLINNLWDFGFYLPEVSFLWWITLGLMLNSATLSPSRMESSIDK